MKYDPRDEKVIMAMGTSVVELMATGLLVEFGNLSVTVEETVEKSTDIPDARLIGDCYLATCVALLIAESPNAKAICDLAIAKVEESAANNAMQEYSSMFKKAVDES